MDNGAKFRSSDLSLVNVLYEAAYGELPYDHISKVKKLNKEIVKVEKVMQKQVARIKEDARIHIEEIEDKAGKQIIQIKRKTTKQIEK